MTPYAPEDLAIDPLLDAIVRFVEGRPNGRWFGGPAELLAELNARASADLRSARAFWPVNTTALGLMLSRRSAGIEARGITLVRRSSHILLALHAAAKAA